VSLDAAGALASLGDTRVVRAVARDAANAVIPSAVVSWSSSNASVASVSGTGSSATVTAVGNGTATITATSAGITGSVSVDVSQRVASVSVAINAEPLEIGGSSSATGVARDGRNAAVAGVSGFVYSSSDRRVVIVDAAGAITAIAPGSTTITATLTRDGVTTSGSTPITVASPLAGAATASVTATISNTFLPASVVIRAGGSVGFSFAAQHNVTFDNAGSPENIPDRSTETVDRTFPVIGTYPYRCTLHAGMNGTVAVRTPALLALLSGANERPVPNNSTANGAAVLARSGAGVSYTITWQGLASAPTGIHIHGPATNSEIAPIIVDLAPVALTAASGAHSGTFTASDIRPAAGRPPISLDSLMVLLESGRAYVNVHSSLFEAGEVRGQVGIP